MYIGDLPDGSGTFFNSDIYFAKVLDDEKDAESFIRAVEPPPETKVEHEKALDNNRIAREKDESIAEMAKKLGDFIRAGNYPPSAAMREDNK